MSSTRARGRRGHQQRPVTNVTPATTDIDLSPPPDVQWPLEWMPRFIQALSAIPNATAAAQVAGVSREYAQRCMQAHPQFREACDEAKERAWELIERYGWQMGTTGVEQVVTKTKVKTVNGRETEREVVTEQGRLISPQMTQFYLRSRWPERYGRDVKVEHTGAGGGPIQHEIHRPLSPDRALELARITLELEAADVVELEEAEYTEEVEPVVEGAIQTGPDSGEGAIHPAGEMEEGSTGEEAGGGAGGGDGSRAVGSGRVEARPVSQ